MSVILNVIVKYPNAILNNNMVVAVVGSAFHTSLHAQCLISFYLIIVCHSHIYSMISMFLGAFFSFASVNVYIYA